MTKQIELVYTKEEILNALESNNFYIAQAARQLEIPRSRMYAYVKRYNIVFEPKMGAIPKHKINDDTVNNIYYKMLNRCNNPLASDYKYYGARGIKVFKEWEGSRDKFSEYFMNLPNFGEPGYSIDRIDNDGNYEPGNIKCSTSKEQCNNKRNNRLIDYNNEVLTLMQFYEKYAKDIGVSYEYVLDRFKLGFTPEQVLNLPKNAKRKFYYKTDV